MENISDFLKFCAGTVICVTAISLTLTQYQSANQLIQIQSKLNKQPATIVDGTKHSIYKKGDMIYGFQLKNLVDSHFSFTLQGVALGGINDFTIYEIAEIEYFNDGILIRRIRVH